MVMARATVGAIMAVFMGVLLLWFALPMLQTVYNQTAEFADLTDPNIERYVNLGNMLFMALSIIAFAVPGYLVFAYATERAPYDR